MEYIWKDRKRFLGMPLSFTRYALSEDRLFLSVGFFIHFKSFFRLVPGCNGGSCVCIEVAVEERSVVNLLLGRTLNVFQTLDLRIWHCLVWLTLSLH